MLTTTTSSSHSTENPNPDDTSCALPLTPDTSPETSPSSTKPVPESSQNLVSAAATASPAHSIATSESSTTLSELINRASTIYDDLMDLE